MVNLKRNYFTKKKIRVVIQKATMANEKGNIKTKKNKILDYDETRKKNYKFVELGYFFFKKITLFSFLSEKNNSFSDVLLKMVKCKKIYFFMTRSIYLSITDLARLNRTKKLIKKHFLYFDK